MAVADVFESEARDILKGLNVEEAAPELVGSLYAIIELADIARKFEGNVNALAYRCEQLEAENGVLQERVRKMDWQMVWLAKQVCDSFSPQEWINRAEQAAKEARE